MIEFVIELAEDFSVGFSMPEDRLQLRDRAATVWPIRRT